MADLLTRAGVAPTAERVYRTRWMTTRSTSRCPDLMAPGVLLATKADGAAIPLGKGGPIRLVFPPDAPAGKNKDLWIWSIDSMTIR
jgi:DMSO/TMAO reductase YedYZ molybdopterin-dependent catalytic subunit